MDARVYFAVGETVRPGDGTSDRAEDVEEYRGGERVEHGSVT